jgi:hypothetical protein
VPRLRVSVEDALLVNCAGVHPDAFPIVPEMSELQVKALPANPARAIPVPDEGYIISRDDRHVPTLRKLDAPGVGLARVFVVTRQHPSQPAHIRSDGGVCARIERGGLAIYIEADAVFGDGVGLAQNGTVYQVAR